MRQRSVLLVVVWMMFTALAAYQPDWIWMQRSFGSGDCSVYDITTDPQGRIVAAGYFGGEVSFGDQTLNSNGTRDGLLAVLGADGSWIWAIAVGGGGADYISSLKTDLQGNIYIAGSFDQSFSLGGYELTCLGYNDSFIAKYDPEGNLISTAAVGSPSMDTLGGIAVTPTGEVYLAGTFLHTITIGETTLTATAYGLYYGKWSADFVPLWVKQGYTTGMPMECRNLGSDPSGNLIMIGNFEQQCALGSPNPLVLYSQNVSGFIVKLSPTGNAIWGESVSLGNFSILSSDVDRAGNSYISGDFTFIIENGEKRLGDMPRCGKLSTNGTWDWYETYSAMESCVFVRITGDDSGNAYLSGNLWGAFDFGGYPLAGDFNNENFFVAKNDPDGDWQWGLQTFDTGNTFYMNIRDIAALPSGDCVIVGSNSSDSVQFGDFLVPSSGSNYCFFIRVNQDTGAAAEDPLIPALPELSIYPNPSLGKVSFRLSDTREKVSSAKVYNFRGQLIKQLPLGDNPESLSWDGLDEQNRPTHPGVYILSISTGERTYRRLFTRF